MESFGVILPSTMAKSAASKPDSYSDAVSVPFAPRFPSKDLLLVSQSMRTENVRLKEQATQLQATIKRQTEARLDMPMSSDLSEGMKQIIMENAKLRGLLRTAENQNQMLKGVVAKNTDLETQYRELLDTYQKSVEDGSALQTKAEEAEARVCMQVIQTEERD